MKKFALLLPFIFLFSYSNAQITINSENVEEWIKQHFAGEGVIIGNIKMHLAGKEAMALFTNKDVLQIEKGLIISTGKASKIAGKNNTYNESTGFNVTNKPEFDTDLLKIVKGKLFDISYVEFDLVPFNNSIQFNYQFGSEEYPEYVGSTFNDIFAFIISDGKISKNIALIPKKNTPVSINTINQLTDSSYYIDNNVFTSQIIARNNQPVIVNKQPQSTLGSFFYRFKKIFKREKVVYNYNLQVMKPDVDLIKKVHQKLYQNLQFDGITTKLVAQTFVEPYRKYTLKIIIADVSDNVYDSGVFLEQESLTTKKDINQPGFKEYTQITDSTYLQKILQGEKSPENPSINKELSFPNQNNNHIIYFDFDQFNIKQSEAFKIEEICKAYQKLDSGYAIQIIGHTDAKAGLNYNLALSNKRSIEVKSAIESYLKKKAIFKIANKAYLIPAATNATDIGRAENRRVEIKFIKKNINE